MVTHFAQLQKHLQFSKAVFLGSASGSDVMKARPPFFLLLAGYPYPRACAFLTSILNF